MNILILSESFYPHGGGAEFATYLYAKLLSQSEFNVYVLTNQFPGESDVSKGEGFTVRRVPLLKKGESIKFSISALSNAMLSVSMRKLIKWADLVYIPRFWFAAIPVAKSLGKPVITHLHDFIPICPMAVLYDSVRNTACKKRNICSARCIYAMERRKRSVTESAESAFLNILASFFVRKLVGLSDGIVCVSNKQRQILVENLPSIADKTKVIYNPLPALQPVGIRGDDFGYFGGPSYSKGFVVLLRALSLLGRSSLTVHATGFSCSQVFEDSLTSFGVTTYSRLVQSELGELFQRIRGVLVPSVVVESSPYVVSEALLRARVVVASKIGGIPEMVDGCRGVLLFTPGNSRELAEKIAYTSDLRREAATDLGLSNRETFMSRFNNEKTLGDFLELSHSLLADS